MRGLWASKIGNRKRRDVDESRWTTGSQRFPLARAFLEQIAGQQNALLLRAKIVSLLPGHKV